MRVRESQAPWALVTAVAFALGCGATAPQQSIVGDWALLSFTDHGVVGTTTGTVTFNDDGTWGAIGTVTYPGEPEDSIAVSGTYRVNGNDLTLTTGGSSAVWTMTWDTDRVTLTLQGSDPANVMVLGGRLTL